MTYLILGLIFWTAAHLFKRVAPDLRARMGNAGKGLAAVGILVGLVLMIYGYRQAAVFVYGMSATKGRLRGAMRHPQLTAVKIWAVAHLLVNGDLASLVLFGGLLAWAVLEVVVINLSEEWERPQPGEAKKDVILVVITVVMFLVITLIHNWLGVWPFPG